MGEGLNKWGLNLWWAVAFLHNRGEDTNALNMSASEKGKEDLWWGGVFVVGFVYFLQP